MVEAMERAEDISEAVDDGPRLGRHRVIGVLWKGLRHVLCMILTLVRIPLQFISRFVFLPLVGFGVFWGFAAGWTSPACLWMIGTGIGLFVVSFLFDTLLLWVSPEQLYLES
jgi:hypothetical protein